MIGPFEDCGDSNCVCCQRSERWHDEAVRMATERDANIKRAAQWEAHARDTAAHRDALAAEILNLRDAIAPSTHSTAHACDIARNTRNERDHFRRRASDLESAIAAELERVTAAWAKLGNGAC